MPHTHFADREDAEYRRSKGWWIDVVCGSQSWTPLIHTHVKNKVTCGRCRRTRAFKEAK